MPQAGRRGGCAQVRLFHRCFAAVSRCFACIALGVSRFLRLIPATVSRLFRADSRASHTVVRVFRDRFTHVTHMYFTA
eukprot:77164-Prymnesium_polylepis.1